MVGQEFGLEFLSRKLKKRKLVTSAVPGVLKAKYTRCSQEAATIFGTENRRGFLPRPPKKDSVMSPTSFRAKSKIFTVRSSPPPLLSPPLPALQSPSFSPFLYFLSFSSLLPSFFFFPQTNSQSVAQASSNSHSSCLRLQSAGTPGVHHHTCLWMFFHSYSIR